MGDETSEEWGRERVREALKKSASLKGGQAVANVFFGESVSAAELTSAAEKALEAASAKTGAPKPEINRIHRLAKSVSVTGDPDTIAELANVSGVQAVLPSEIEDIYPRPVKRGPASE